MSFQAKSSGRSLFIVEHASLQLSHEHRYSGLSKDAGSHSEELRPLMAITASLQPECGRIGNTGSDLPYRFRFRSSKEGPDHIVLNRSRSDLDGLVRFLGKRIWSGIKPECKTHRAWLWQNATDPLPVSHFQDRYSVHLQMARIILSKTRRDPIWLWLTVSGLGQTDPVRSKPVYKNHPARFWPVLPSQSGLNANQTWHIYWDIDALS